MEFFNEFKVHEIIFFPGSIRISKQNSYETNLLGVQRGFCSAFPRHFIGWACVWISGISLTQIRGWMPQLRALGSSFPFLPDNTDFGAVTYKREKINALHSEHFPTTCQTTQGFLHRDVQSNLDTRGSSSLQGSCLGYPHRSPKCLLQWDREQHWNKAERIYPWFQTLCKPHHPSKDVWRRWPGTVSRLLLGGCCDTAISSPKFQLGVIFQTSERNWQLLLAPPTTGTSQLLAQGKPEIQPCLCGQGQYVQGNIEYIQ